MNCPRCGCRTRVIGVYDNTEHCDRRRKCLNEKCGFRYQSIETFRQECPGPGKFSIGRSEAQEILLLLRAGVLTQKEIAERFGITQQQVSNIKRGKRWGFLQAESRTRA